MFVEEFLENQIGSALIKKVFEISDSNKVAGCSIQDGKVTSKAFARIFRNEKQIAEVQIQSLRREKNQVKEVLSGLECGITFVKFNDIVEDDKIEFLQEKIMRKNSDIDLFKPEKKSPRILKVTQLIKKLLAKFFYN